MAERGRGQRPYGWGWALTLAHELATWDDPDARRWAAAMEPLAAVLTENFLGWLPKATYPVRVGLHANSSFGLSRALPYARLLARASRSWRPPSPRPRTAGMRQTRTIPGAGSRPGMTSCRRRWPRRSL